MAISTYQQGEQIAPDLEPWPNDTGRWSNVCPHLGEFLSEGRKRPAELHGTIGEEEWERCNTPAEDYRRRHGNRAREGSLLFTDVPAN